MDEHPLIAREKPVGVLVLTHADVNYYNPRARRTCHGVCQLCRHRHRKRPPI